MRKIFFSLLLVVFSVSVGAVTLSGLYAAKVPIHSEIAWRRLQVMPKALQQVFVKVSGNVNVAQIPAIQAALKSAQDYVLQYSYIKKAEGANKQLILHVDFDPRAVRNVLSNAGQTVWGRNRPLTLLWLAVDNGQDAKIVGSSSNSLVVQTIGDDASMRGIPLLLPLMDLTDMQKINVQDIIQGQWNDVQQASQRYVPDAILLVSVDSSTPNNVTSNWTLSLQGNIVQWQESGNTVTAVLNLGFNDLASTLAKQYGVEKAQQAQVVQMQVTGVDNIKALSKVKRYLSDLTGVGHVDIVTVLPDQVTFNLTLTGDLNSFMQQIKLGNQLISIPQSIGMIGKQQGLIYRYNALN